MVYGSSPPTILSYYPGLAKLETMDQELYSWDLVLQDLYNRLLQAHNSIKARYDAKHRPVQFHIGDQVYLNYNPIASSALRSQNSLNSPHDSIALSLLLSKLPRWLTN